MLRISLAVNHKLGGTLVLLTGLTSGLSLPVGTTLTSVEVDVDTDTASSMILIGFICGKKDSLMAVGGKLVDSKFHFPSVCSSIKGLIVVVVVVVDLVVVVGVVMTGK